jgi:hypothetical protein
MIGNSTIEEASQIIELLGIASYELDNPKRYSQLQDVAAYFKGDPSLRTRILQILSKGNGDKLDSVWTFVELHNEKARALQKLDPAQFAEDIEEQIKTGILTQDNLNRIKKDIEIQEKHYEKYQDADRAEHDTSDKVASLLAKPKPVDILQETKNLLSQVEKLNKELSFYE